MTNASIAKIIKQINVGGSRRHAFVAPGDNWVRRGTAWERFPDGKKPTGPSTFWFIFDGGVCVGAVQDGGNDMHAYMSKGFRGQGLMTRAFREVILPALSMKEDSRPFSFKTDEGRRLFERISGRSVSELSRGEELSLEPYRTTAPEREQTSYSLAGKHLEEIQTNLKLARQLTALVQSELLVLLPEDHPQRSEVDDALSEVESTLSTVAATVRWDLATDGG